MLHELVQRVEVDVGEELAAEVADRQAEVCWLCSQALEILASIPRRDGCSWVFPSPTGKRVHKIDDWWIAFRRKCGLVDVRIHDLRHSYASAAIMANVPLTSVGRLLGHKHPESTARYTHLADDVVADAAARVSDDLAMKLGIAA